jgi:hypothetical protein
MRATTIATFARVKIIPVAVNYPGVVRKTLTAAARRRPGRELVIP